LEAWDPATAKQVSDAARVTVNTASTMLLRLAEPRRRYQERRDRQIALYSASERLFNIYYLMRAETTRPAASARWCRS